MADNPELRSGRDRSRVAGEQVHEVRYLSEKLGVSEDAVKEAINRVGNDREKVEAYLRSGNQPD